MLKDLPESVRNAFKILYEFADDVSVYDLRRESAEIEGFNIDGQSCHLITFAISKNRSWEDVIA